MAGMGTFDFSEFEKFRDNLVAMEQAMPAFMMELANEAGNRFLAKVVRRTPVGSYDSGGWVNFTANIPERQVSFTTKDGKRVSFTARARTIRVSFKSSHGSKTGGALRRAWTLQQNSAGAGGVYEVEVFNPTYYSAYVEYGHRTANHKGWVEGQFFMTNSHLELKRELPPILERKLERFLARYLGD
ncbi:Bacteriophage HK97-gp10, putative tail-component [Paenibacillus algorifonticola]|uniref:Bacteriophage HK97-gp10, putative tail-component n=1 Tax=Paenibacillus algorifonticola TaxID=684063 RepID=A0A1I2GYQ8_9BACL|nr:HK97 gp10 family phage protein [Paenibacillus algorifonticola]SFF23084.1 Bacteriophage HK97-gp10, putative tail-component [Paenibacillus algorifonticola]